MDARKSPVNRCSTLATGPLWHLPLDALRHELQVILDVLLKAAIGRAARHNRAHAAVALVGGICRFISAGACGPRRNRGPTELRSVTGSSFPEARLYRRHSSWHR